MYVYIHFLKVLNCVARHTARHIKCVDLLILIPVQTILNMCVSLQIEARSEDGETVDGPYSVVLQVVDINNNAPVFSESQFSGRVREHSPAGEKHTYYH